MYSTYIIYDNLKILSLLINESSICCYVVKCNRDVAQSENFVCLFWNWLISIVYTYVCLLEDKKWSFYFSWKILTAYHFDENFSVFKISIWDSICDKNNFFLAESNKLLLTKNKINPHTKN